MNWLGIDIGGANLKLADGKAYAAVASFPLWRQPQQLTGALSQLLASAPTCGRLAVTMTGELADCFQTKEDGVRFILQSVRQTASGFHIQVYLTDGRLVPVDVALAEPLAAAASNWHALASFAGRYAPNGPAMLFDIGSTTCDLIPLLDGRSAASGSTDTKRLLAGELLYTGVERSPVCAVVDRVPYRGESCPLAHELFATMRDVYLFLGETPEDCDCHDTADGRPATLAAARSRLARMICADPPQFDESDAMTMASAVAQAQAEGVGRAFRQVTASMAKPPMTIVVSGHGYHLARRVLAAVDYCGKIVSLGDRLGPDLSRVAASHALAVLAGEMGKT
jgi:probable H4MPT-linked C1 transfer pathway protein